MYSKEPPPVILGIHFFMEIVFWNSGNNCVQFTFLPAAAAARARARVRSRGRGLCMNKQEGVQSMKHVMAFIIRGGKHCPLLAVK